MSDKANDDGRISGGDYLRMGLVRDALEAYARDGDKPSPAELDDGLEAILESCDLCAPSVFLATMLGREEGNFADGGVELDPAAFRRRLTDEGDAYTTLAETVTPDDPLAEVSRTLAPQRYAMAFVWDVKRCGVRFPGWGPQIDTVKMFEAVLALLPKPPNTSE